MQSSSSSVFAIATSMPNLLSLRKRFFGKIAVFNCLIAGSGHLFLLTKRVGSCGSYRHSIRGSYSQNLTIATNLDLGRRINQRTDILISAKSVSISL